MSSLEEHQSHAEGGGGKASVSVIYCLEVRIKVMFIQIILCTRFCQPTDIYFLVNTYTSNRIAESHVIYINFRKLVQEKKSIKLVG